jgi:sensor histidine kinase YesM
MNSRSIAEDKSQIGHETFLSQARIAILAVVGPALLAVVLFLTTGHIPISQTGRSLVFSLIYSASIGVPAALLLNWISWRWTDRIPKLIVAVQAFTLVLTAVIGTLITGLILRAAHLLPAGQYWREVRSSGPFALVITLIVGMSIVTWETLRYKLQAADLELRTRQVAEERARKLAAEAQLSSLESRIHPHFLFNTLNSIASLIPQDPQRAERMVEKLAALLRFSLAAHHTGLTRLDRELDIVGAYLEIEKQRFGSRLLYSIAVPPSLRSCAVPPLSVQSLVENAIKHVVTQRSEGGEIQVRGSSADGAVLIEVIDNGPGFTMEAMQPAHGLDNLRARMQLLFGEEASIAVRREQDRTAVQLRLPARGE